MAQQPKTKAQKEAELKKKADEERKQKEAEARKAKEAQRRVRFMYSSSRYYVLLWVKECNFAPEPNCRPKKRKFARPLRRASSSTIKTP